MLPSIKTLEIEQRDEAIRRANKRVDIHHAAVDSEISQASSLAGDATSDGIYIIEAPTEVSQTSLTEEVNYELAKTANNYAKAYRVS